MYMKMTVILSRFFELHTTKFTSVQGISFSTLHSAKTLKFRGFNQTNFSSKLILMRMRKTSDGGVKKKGESKYFNFMEVADDFGREMNMRGVGKR